MSTEQSPSLRLTVADFDAYLPERGRSNAFTRPRLELKQRMLGWGRGVVTRLAELGVTLEISGSDEHPNVRNGRNVDCQRVFFWRDAEARAKLDRLLDSRRSLAAALDDPAPHKAHAYLALKVDPAHIEVSIELHEGAWVDVRNLRARLGDPSRALELASALEVLPEQYAIGLATEATAPAHRASAADVRGLLDQAEATKRPLWIGWSVPRDVALAHADVLADQLEDAIVALGPLYKLVAWAHDNDLLVLDRELSAARDERARAHEEAERSRADWESRREREGERQRGKRSSREAPPSKPQRERAHERMHAQPTAAESAPAAGRPQAQEIRRLPKRPRLGPRVVASVDPKLPVEKGARVEVLRGPFAGKVGVVQELDGRGGARVLLGLLAMRLEVTDLVASVGARPVLSSSHRRPMPAR